MSLVAHYKFDDPIGSTTYADSTGNGNTITPASLSLVRLVPSVINPSTNGNCYQSDASGINGNGNSTVAGLNITGNALSISAWCRNLSSTVSFMSLIGRGNGSNFQFLLEVSASNVSIGLNVFIGTLNRGSLSNPSISGMAWNHVAFTWNGAEIRFFINGTYISSQALSTTMTSLSGAVTRIGLSLPSSTASNMEMDELKLWDETISDAAINAYYLAELPNFVRGSMPIIQTNSFNTQPESKIYAFPQPYRTDFGGVGSNRPSKGQLWPKGSK